MIDFSKYKKGDIIKVHCCNDCLYRRGIKPKFPPDSGASSLLCSLCCHYNIGSLMTVVIGDCLKLNIVENG